MRVKVTKSKNNQHFSIIKSFRDRNGKNTSKVVENLGNLETVSELAALEGMKPLEWAKRRAEILTELEKKKQANILVKYSPAKQLPLEKQVSFNGGYLFIKQLYNKVGMPKICQKIKQKYKFQFDLNAVLEQLVFSRVLFPGSKVEAFRQKEKYIEQSDVQLQHFYRALEVVAKENDYIQAELYKGSQNVIPRDSKILYYDCTNFFFEIEQENGIRQYGHSKEHRPNPIVQMGLFLDGNGIPLAFDITPGNTNEQTTLKPLEKKIIKDFNLSKLVVCTDAGLSSMANRTFNNYKNRAFITTQSLKKLKKHLKEWALNKDGWKCSKLDKNRMYTLEEIDELGRIDLTFYKDRWVNENGLEQRMIVSYSLKYKRYQENIRNRQIDRAIKFVNSGNKMKKNVNQNDYKRFIEQTKVTSDGEIASKEQLSISEERITKEAMYDGFYAVCTNLEDPIDTIVSINHNRWEIEETFRIMKSEFKARPVHLSREDRIRAHFTTCFLSITIFRILEKLLHEKFSTHDIITTLKNMNFLNVPGEGYIPTYTRTELTDQLHEQAGFHTDFQLLSKNSLKKILKHIE